MRWAQLFVSLKILWHCLSLGLEWKLTLSSPVPIAEFSTFAGILRVALGVKNRKSKHRLWMLSPCIYVWRNVFLANPECSGLNFVHFPRVYFEIPLQQNVILSRNSVIAHIIAQVKKMSYRCRVGCSPMCLVSLEGDEHMKTQRHVGMPCGNEGREWSCVVVRQVISKIVGRPPETRKRQGRIPLS